MFYAYDLTFVWVLHPSHTHKHQKSMYSHAHAHTYTTCLCMHTITYTHIYAYTHISYSWHMNAIECNMHAAVSTYAVHVRVIRQGHWIASLQKYTTHSSFHIKLELSFWTDKKLKIPFQPLPSPVEKHSDPEPIEGYDTHPKEGNPS